MLFMENNIFDWAEELDCAVTVCDTDGIILYMNARSRQVNADGASMVGQSLIPCHNERSRAIIAHMLATGESNSYTISKRGQRKFIHQTPWRRDGKICGLVEFSIVIPDEMPHYVRQ